MPVRNEAAAQRAAERRAESTAKREAAESEARSKFQRGLAFHKTESTAQQERSEAISTAVELILDYDPQLLWRVEILRRQIPEEGPVSPDQCMVVQGLDGGKGNCISCGEPLKDPATWRCPYCIKAYRMVWAEQQEWIVRRESAVEMDDDFALD